MGITLLFGDIIKKKSSEVKQYDSVYISYLFEITSSHQKPAFLCLRNGTDYFYKNLYGE